MDDGREAPLELTYYSDLLCVFAYASEAKLEALAAAHGATLNIIRRACDSFGDTEAKIGEGWREKGGWTAYADHVAEIAGRFEHIALHADVWRRVRPKSSHSAHLLVKALELSDLPQDASAAAAWALRRAFFAEAADIGRQDVQREVLARAGVDAAAADEAINDGRAFAALAADYAAATRQKIEGSPSFVFPDARQKLYGDVGFRMLDANVRERLRPRAPDDPSWA